MSMNQPTPDEVNEALNSLERLKVTIEPAPWVIVTHGGRPLPVDEILERADPGYLVGKR